MSDIICQTCYAAFPLISENNMEALNEAIRLDYSAYDMLYLTLARRTGALLRLKELLIITTLKNLV
jgi:hypothetical protein